MGEKRRVLLNAINLELLTFRNSNKQAISKDFLLEFRYWISFAEKWKRFTLSVLSGFASTSRTTTSPGRGENSGNNTLSSGKCTKLSVIRLVVLYANCSKSIFWQYPRVWWAKFWRIKYRWGLNTFLSEKSESKRVRNGPLEKLLGCSWYENYIPLSYYRWADAIFRHARRNQLTVVRIA